MRDVLTTFVSELRNQRGDVYLKLVGFSGGSEQLTLTDMCTEDFCLVGHDVDRVQTEYSMLQSTISTYPTTLDNWDAHDPGSTSFYEAVLTAAREFKIATRARANLFAMEPDYAAPSATAERLVVFSDVDETAYSVAIPARDPTDDSMRSKMFRILQQDDLASEVSLIYLDPPVTYATITADITEIESILQDVIHADNIDSLAQTFLEMADRIDREANAWYELILCPPERAGDAVFLLVQSLLHDGSLETDYSANGFSNSCPETNSFSQSATTSLCATRSCGFQVTRTKTSHPHPHIYPE